MSSYSGADNKWKLIKHYGEVSDQVTGGQAAAWAYGGSGYCAYFDPSSTTESLKIKFNVPVESSTNPQIKFYVKKTASAATCTLKITVYDTDGSTKLIDGTPITLTDSWVQYSAASVSPSANGFITVELSALDGGTTGDIGVDDVSYVLSSTTYTAELEAIDLNRNTMVLDSTGGGGGSSSAGTVGYSCGL